MLTYLDGKTILLADPEQPPAAAAKSHVLKREQVEALEVAHRGGSTNNGPWTTEVHFVFNTGDGRYAVIVKVDHKLIESTRAFYGFQVAQLSKQ